MQKNAKFSQTGIKNENTLAIFSTIANSDGICRAEISEITGLSLMTVGKVADTLTHQGIIKQAKPATGNAGRRAGKLTLSENYFILTLDISTPKFRATAYGLNLSPFDTLVYQYNDSLMPEDNLVIFFRDACSLLMKHLMTKKLAGMGVGVPGEYDSESDTIISPKLKELEGIRITDTIKKSIGISPDRIMHSVEAAALSEISDLSAEKCGCTISINLDSRIAGCIAFEDNILHRNSDFESLICKNGKKLGRNLSEITDEEELCSEIGSALKPIISILCPDSIFICASERVFTEWFPSFLRNELKTSNCEPQIFFENTKKSRSDMGLAQLIRNDMVIKI